MFLILSCPLTNFKIEKYYQNEPNFKGASSRNNLCNIKDGTYAINLDQKKSKGSNLIVLCANGDNLINFNRSRLEYIPKEIEKTYRQQKHQNKHL